MRKREVLLAHFLVGLYFAIQLLAFVLPRSWRCVVGNYCCTYVLRLMVMQHDITRTCFVRRIDTCRLSSTTPTWRPWYVMNTDLVPGRHLILVIFSGGGRLMLYIMEQDLAVGNAGE